jgi:putative nucleotidyltransferase with HDIG domain
MSPMTEQSEQARDRRHPAKGLRGIGERLSALLRTRIPRIEKPLGPYLEVAARVAEWADRRDAFEPGHAERVTSFCAMIGEGLRLDAEETSSLLRAAMLHDIGKVALPFEVLHQRKPLDEPQQRMMRTHPQRGAALLRALDRDDAVADAIEYHHECPNGSGYYGKGEETPRTSRILAVAEVYDAMTSSRVKERLSRDEALERLEALKGEQLDADCVEALIDTLRPRAAAIPLSPTV